MLSELALPPETEEIGQFCSCGGLKTDVADKIMKKKDSYFQLLLPLGFMTTMFRYRNVVVMKLNGKRSWTVCFLLSYSHKMKRNRDVQVPRYFRDIGL